MKSKFVTPGETTEEREEFWLEKIAEAREYDGGIAKFCRDHNIGKEIYYQWFGRLKDRIEDWRTPLDTNRKRRKSPPKKKTNVASSPARSRREWLALVEECRNSGLTPSAFANKKGLNKCTFCRWVRKAAGTYVDARKKSTTLPLDDFVPVRVIDTPVLVAQPGSNADFAIEVVLVNNRVCPIKHVVATKI